MLLDLAMGRASLCLPAPHQPSAGAQENQRAEPGSASGHEGLYPALPFASAEAWLSCLQSSPGEPGLIPGNAGAAFISCQAAPQGQCCGSTAALSP